MAHEEAYPKIYRDIHSYDECDSGCMPADINEIGGLNG